MKNKTIFGLLWALVLSVGTVFAVEAVTWTNAKKVRVDGEQSLAINIWDHDNPTVVIDTTEVDTSNIYLDIFNRTLYSYTDTIGHLWYTCDDSSGTDSVAGRMYWDGNPSVDRNKGKWEVIDSVSIAAASGAETQTKAPIINSKRYALIRFRLFNQLAAAAGKKTSCYNMYLNMPRRYYRPSN